MTDWWNTGPVHSSEPDVRQARVHEDMDRIARSGEDLSSEPDEWGYDGNGTPVDVREEPAEPGAQKPDRRKGILLGAAGAAVAGVIVFAAMPHGGSTPSGFPGSSVTASQDDPLPPAGGNAPEASGEPQQDPTSAAPKVVTMTVAPSGTGRVGALLKVTIHNGTDDTITVMATMMKGDDRPAVLGEGTLAPGARKVEPGETVTGTVEFASKQAPSQVVLFDIGGNVVAASG